MTSENPFRSLDLSAGSFSIATIIQFYDFLKLDRRMGVGVGGVLLLMLSGGQQMFTGVHAEINRDIKDK